MQYVSPITKDNDIVNKKYVDNIVSEINTEIESLEAQIGNPENLETEDKSSLVNAINEIKASAGGGSASLPIGVIMPIATPVVPEKWLLCDGSEISRETYSDLFNAIGEIYGVGDGSTTFNLPDMRYKVPVGEVKDTATLYSQASATIKYLRLVPTAELSNYNVDDIIEYNGETRVITEITTSTNYVQFSFEITFGVVIASGEEVVLHKKFGSIGGEKSHILNVNEMPTHSHTGTIYTSASGNEGRVVDASSTFGALSKTYSVTMGTTGGSQAHNIMQPYITMNYIIYSGV